ncbi:AbrB family transcriptional regulator [Puniceibacterium sp. IMCC21224]|uniref:AbrB family transcriptional regulator n=1 Tax=Puniceibacterium sp. IMCC21224 TaxID=1618204 RepID=UPI00065D2CAD|nr:AbrB family transcriptional regulator [Puniceibacterium sp. IMCC21224]KMK66551.1 putative ammonia monooxygenase [Puniceibacterium sp. IMCC21224]
MLPLLKPHSPSGKRLMTFLIAVIGTALFWLTGLPLPFLFGPLTACLIAALIGVPLRGFGQVSVGARSILGVAVGASITPELLGQLPQMAASVALVPVYIIVIAVIGVPFFHRVCGFDKVTAWYAAMPGGLQDMVVFGTEAGGDGRALSLIHATRVLIVISIAPVILTMGMGAELSNPIGAPARDLPLTEMALMVFAALFGWKGGERIGLFGAAILGPMIVTAVLSLAGLIHTRPPAEGILFAQFMIGLGIGVGYVGITLVEFRKDVLSGVAFVLVLALLAAGFTEVVVYFGLAHAVEGFLAFAPGGQAEMTVLAIVAGADLGFVVVHHLTRIFLVITCAPLAARLMIGKSGR